MERESTKSLIQKLESQQGPCVSIYLPTFRTGTEVEQNRIRFKNLIRQADKKLAAEGHRSDRREHLLQPAVLMLDDQPFWENQLDGLAVFICDGESQHFLLPVSTGDLVVTSNRTHIKPLLDPLSRDEEFYILTFTKERVKLFRTQRFGLHHQGRPLMSLVTEEEVSFKSVSQELQFHTGAPRRSGRRDAVFFGGEETGKWPKKELLKEFKHISQRLRHDIDNEKAPIVLVGLDYLHGFFRDSVSFANVLQEGVGRNPEDFSEHELHERASEIIDARQTAARNETAEQYRTLAGADSPRVSHRIKEVVLASFHGRVEALFVAVGRQAWGTVDHDAQEVVIREEAGPGDYDLLDLAALNSLEKGGRVFAVPPDDVPAPSPIAAIYRY